MNGFLHHLRGSTDGTFAAIEVADFVPFILPILALSVCSGIIFAAWLIPRHLRAARRAQAGMRRRLMLDSWGDPVRFHPQVLESPCRWLAIRSANPQAVQEALNLHNPMRCSWTEGLAEARERKLFISPPIDGWILVVGASLPDPGDDVDRCFRFLNSLSRKLGEVQFFGVNRALHHHAWAKLENGRVLRAYAWAGQTLWNQGRQTFAEADMGLKSFGYFETPQRMDFTQPDPLAINTERVPALAARWSIDPTMVDERQLHSGQGIAGDLSSSLTF
jgi:hypothetical protein